MQFYGDVAVRYTIKILSTFWNNKFLILNGAKQNLVLSFLTSDRRYLAEFTIIMGRQY